MMDGLRRKADFYFYLEETRFIRVWNAADVVKVDCIGARGGESEADWIK